MKEMIDWDIWNIQHEKGKPNAAGMYLLDIRGIIHEKLVPGHQIREVRQVIPMSKEGNVGQKLKEFEVFVKGK